MFTLTKKEILRFHDAIRIIEKDSEGSGWVCCWATDQSRKKSYGKTRKNALAWALKGPSFVIVLEKISENTYRAAGINIRHEYLLGAAQAAGLVTRAYEGENPTDDYLALNKAINFLNESMEIDRETDNLKTDPPPHAPLEINAWANALNDFNPDKLYEFSGDFTLTTLQKLTPRVGIIQQNAAGIYLYKEAGAQNYSKGLDKRECLERLVFNGCYLLAEKQKKGKYKIIYNDLENSNARGFAAIAILVKAVYQLPLPSAEKKKLIFSQIKSFLTTEKKNFAQKFNLREYI